jgi:type II restriction enzyme
VSGKHRLRLSRAETVINLTSSKQETELGKALELATAELLGEFELRLVHEKSWKLSEIVDGLEAEYPDVDFYSPPKTASMKPDGGVLSLEGREGKRHPILISEVKNQGTNDLRKEEGKAAQARGNAIERLGKNVIGIRAAMLAEGIMPFVCFGYGVDFEDGSYILDRVATIAMFGELNKVNVVNLGAGEQFNRGSFFFREKKWSVEEMREILVEVGSKSIHYYLAKHGRDAFVPDVA